MVTPETMQEARYYQESKCQLRNPETHFEQRSKLTGHLKDHYSTNYGINHLTVLEEVPGVSVVTSMPHDIMHDLFEGIVPLELSYGFHIASPVSISHFKNSTFGS